MLAEHGARATFFVLGESVNGHWDVLERTAFAGHQIGNHGFTHRPLVGLPREEVLRELTSTATVVRRMTGLPPGVFRAPFLEVDETVLAAAAECGYAGSVGADVAGDWELDPAQRIAEAVLAGARDGAIVLLHDGSPPREEPRDRTPTVAAVRLLLPALRERGYELVTVSELLEA